MATRLVPGRAGPVVGCFGSLVGVAAFLGWPLGWFFGSGVFFRSGLVLLGVCVVPGADGPAALPAPLAGPWPSFVLLVSFWWGAFLRGLVMSMPEPVPQVLVVVFGLSLPEAPLEPALPLPLPLLL